MKTTCLLLIGLLCASQVRAQEEPKVVSVPCIVGGAIIVGGLYVGWQLKKLCDRVLPPCTNNCVPPPPSTNAPPSKPPKGTNSTPRLSLSNASIHAWSFDGATCEKDPAGNDYVAMLAARFQTSTNLSDWGDLCSFTGWVSPAYVLTVWTGADGVPISTNCDLIGTDVSVALPELSGSRRFFK